MKSKEKYRIANTTLKKNKFGEQAFPECKTL